jgi:hypothetical protein
LDAMIFSSPSSAFAKVMVAGRWVIRGGEAANARAVGDDFAAAMRALWMEIV